MTPDADAGRTASEPPRLPALIGRNELIAAITTFLAADDTRAIEGVREMLEREVDAAGPAALAALGARLASTVEEWTYYPPDPLARRLHHALADVLLDPRSHLEGAERLDALGDRGVLLLGNHLSYSDANLIEVLLRRSGGAAAADRLTVIAGPKVYSSLKRRFSSLCFGTIRVAQSSTLSSEDAVMNPREVARAARRAIEMAHDRLRQGDALLIFAEGTRSRTFGMQAVLPAVARYLEGPEVAVVPVAITGTEALFPVGEEVLHSVPIVVRIGAPIESVRLRQQSRGDRRLMMDAIGLAIAGLLPPAYRGAYAETGGPLEPARRLLEEVSPPPA